MIGTTLKIGFDGNQVSRGLHGLSSKLGKFGKEIAIGGARQVGAGVTDLLGKVAMAVPNLINNTLDWAGELNDLGNQTGMAVDKLVEFQELLRLTGVDADSTGKMIFTMTKNVRDAARDGGDLADGLKAIGLEAETLQNMSPDKMFEAITRRVGELNATTQTPVNFTDPVTGQVTTKIVELTSKMQDLEKFGSDLFGAKMGYKWIGVARDFSGSIDQAKNNVGALGVAMAEDIKGFDTLGESLGRIQNFSRSVGSIALSEFGNLYGFDGIDKLFDTLDPEKLRPKIRELTTFVNDGLQTLLSQDIGKTFDGIMQSLGKAFGQGISSGISVKSLLPTWLGGGSGKSTAMVNPVPELETHTQILSDIRKNTLTARFA